MDRVTVNDIDRWYRNYVDGFRSGDSVCRKNIDLKDHHTRHVRREIIDIGQGLSLSEGDLRMAEALALLHDVGRFPQYARYRTFSDAASEDHAALGVAVIEEQAVLARLDPGEREIIVKSISVHNKKNLPAGENERCLLFARLLRDADKLDIFRVVIDHYLGNDYGEGGAIELDLSNAPEISDEVAGDLAAGQIVDMRHVRTLNDFKLLQMSWVYDINFAKTRERIRERNYLGEIARALPRSKAVEDICRPLGEWFRVAPGARIG